MNQEQWFGVAGIVVGLYLFVCATWKRDFILYAMKARRAVAWYGEKRAHVGFQLGGLVIVVVGVLKVLEII